MQQLSSALTAALIDIDARVTPRVIVDLYEFYESDTVPGVDGFDPVDAIETFAAEEITWNGIAYRREVVSRGDVVRNFGEKTNSVSLNFSNISRYLATLAQEQQIEGLFLVIRTVVPSVTDDSIVLFVGRCDKPSDIDKKSFSLSARQDFGNINQSLPPRDFVAEDPIGRTPSDPLYEGFRIVATNGTFPVFVTTASTSFFGRLLGKKKTEIQSRQWSSLDETPYGSVVPITFGRCQMELIPIMFADIGYSLIGVWVVGEGRVETFTNVKLRGTDQFTIATERDAYGDPGGTGTNNYAVNPSDYPQGAIHHGYLSKTAYAVLSIRGSSDAVDEAPTVTALVKGVRVPVPNSSGVFDSEAWSDNPVAILRFILTDPRLVGINPGYMEDSINYETFLHCDEPLIDDSNGELTLIATPDVGQVGTGISRYRSTGIIDTRYTRRYLLEEPVGEPEFDPPPIEPFDPGDIPTVFPITRILRKRYTVNVPITEKVRAVDFAYKVINPAAKLFIRINKRGKYEIRSEQPSDATMLRSSTAVGDTSIPILDVTPWKTGPDLLTQRLLLGFGLTTSEVRNVSSAVYSTSGNSVTLDASVTGTITAIRSGATLSGGSTSVQASGTVTIGGTPANGDTVTITINGIASVYTLNADDTTGSVASLLAAYINATPQLKRYIKATWDSGSPTVITITCKHGALTLNSQLLKAHTGPIADPTTTPSLSSSTGVLEAGTYKLAYSDVTAIGQTALSPQGSITIVANKQIDVGAIALVGASRNWFMSDAADSEHLKFVANTNGSAFSINALPLPNAAIPRGYNTTGEELIRVAMSFATNSQDIYPVWKPNTPVLLGEIYLPTEPNGHKYEVTTAGTTGASEPTWPTGGSFSPSDIVGLQVWLKADALSLSDNDPVSTWADSSGNGHNATQGTSGSRPIYKTGILNGLPVVRFDGSDDSLSLGDLSVLFPSAATILMVAKINSDTQYCLYETRSGSDGAWVYTDGSSYMDAFRSSRADSLAWSMPNTGWHVFTLSSSASTYSFRLDGGTAQTATPAYLAGTQHKIGERATSGRNLDGDIAEIVVFDSVLSTGDRQLIEDYFGDKYGLTIATPLTGGDSVISGTAVFTESGSTVLQQAGLTRANIVKDSYKWPLGSKQSSVNQIKGNYRDSNSDFALTPFKVNDPIHQAKVGGKVYPLEADLSAVDNSHQKDRIANWLLAKNREGDWFVSLETGPQGLVLEEGDVICSSDDSGGLVNVVTRIEELRIKPNHDVSIATSRRYSTLMFLDEVGADAIPVPSTLRFTQTVDSIIEFIDNFAIRDSDALVAGFYVAVSRDLSTIGDWRGWVLYADYGDGYVEIARGDIPAIMGTADSVLGNVTDSTVFDRVNSFDFTLKYGPPAPFPNPFTTVSETELLSNPRRNLFLVGDEYVQAAEVTDNGDFSYTASTLLRARFSTVNHTAHGADERVVYLDGSETLVKIDPVRVGSEYNYKIVTTNQSLGDVSAIPFTWTGGTMKLPPPGALRGLRDSDNNLLILWNRRSRIGAGLRPFSDVPLGEEKEEYLVTALEATPPRSWPVITGMGIAALLKSIPQGDTEESFTDIDVNSLILFGTGDTRAHSLQSITETGNYAEATLMLDTFGVVGFGLIATNGDWTGGADAKSQANYYVELVSVDGVNYSLDFYVDGVSVYTEAVDEPIAVAGLRVRLTLSGSEVRFTKSWTGTGTPAQYVSVVQPNFPLMVLAQVQATTTGFFKVSKIMMTISPQPATIYTAAQRTEDGLVVADPVLISVQQVSAIVGPGEAIVAAI